MPNDNSAAALELSNIKLSLPLDTGDELEILKGIDLEVGNGTRCGLKGPSGSGKTSLLTILAGLRRPTAGDIRILGEQIDVLSEESLVQFRRDNIGVVFQNFHLLPTMTALENVAMPLEIAGEREVADRASEALKIVGLGHRMDHFPHQLSGGEQQRTAIARAFIARPKIILADEPTGNLDGKTSEHVMEMLIRLSSEHKSTMLFITHNEALLDEMQMVVQMNDGLLSGA